MSKLSEYQAEWKKAVGIEPVPRKSVEQIDSEALDEDPQEAIRDFERTRTAADMRSGKPIRLPTSSRPAQEMASVARQRQPPATALGQYRGFKGTGWT
jgi:hypothetical protein